MNVIKFYETINGDYDGVFSRMLTDARIEKYLLKFAEGKDFKSMHEALALKNYPDAFRFTHNLKGISLNLGLTKLAVASSELCEKMRPGVSPKIDITDLLSKVDAEFEHVCAEIKAAQ